MASFAHVAHPNQQYVMVRAELAQQRFQYTLLTIEQLARFAKRIVASARPALQRWAAAQRQAVQDRIFWQLALTDRRLMDELRVLKDHAEPDGAARLR